MDYMNVDQTGAPAGPFADEDYSHLPDLPVPPPRTLGAAAAPAGLAHQNGTASRDSVYEYDDLAEDTLPQR